MMHGLWNKIIYTLFFLLPTTIVGFIPTNAFACSVFNYLGYQASCIIILFYMIIIFIAFYDNRGDKNIAYNLEPNNEYRFDDVKCNVMDKSMLPTNRSTQLQNDVDILNFCTEFDPYYQERKISRIATASHHEDISKKAFWMNESKIHESENLIHVDVNDSKRSFLIKSRETLECLYTERQTLDETKPSTLYMNPFAHQETMYSVINRNMNQQDDIDLIDLWTNCDEPDPSASSQVPPKHRNERIYSNLVTTIKGNVRHEISNDVPNIDENITNGEKLENILCAGSDYTELHDVADTDEEKSEASNNGCLENESLAKIESDIKCQNTLGQSEEIIKGFSGNIHKRNDSNLAEMSTEHFEMVSSGTIQFTQSNGNNCFESDTVLIKENLTNGISNVMGGSSANISSDYEHVDNSRDGAGYTETHYELKDSDKESLSDVYKEKGLVKRRDKDITHIETNLEKLKTPVLDPSDDSLDVLLNNALANEYAEPKLKENQEQNDMDLTLDESAQEPKIELPTIEHNGNISKNYCSFHVIRKNNPIRKAIDEHPYLLLSLYITGVYTGYCIVKCFKK